MSLSDTNPSAPSPSGDQMSTVKRAILELRELRARLERQEREANEPIAVIGLGCRFPGSDGPDAYWRVLRDGVDAIREVPPDRWDADALYDPDPEAPGKIYTRHGGFLDAIDGFDAALFGISPREAVRLDPQQRLLLEVAWEALEHAAQPADRLLGSRTGVFVGICSNEYASLQLGGEIDAYFGTGSALSIAAGRLSYFFGFQGPSVALDTACSSSLVATHLACQSLRNNECRLALAGGVNLMLRPESTVNFCRARMLAPDGRCKTFDAAADGYSRGEGAGIVVLKRLSHAIEDGDRVLAVVLGSAVNQDGRSSGLTVPNGPSQEALLREAVARARVSPAEIGYLEAHGTGTALGDPIEIRSACAVLGEGRSPDRPLVVGSVKTNLGHLEAAAGVAGLIKVVLALEHGEIPRHLHFSRLNPHIDAGGVPLQVPTETMAWPAGSARRVAGVSAFGFSGTNAHVLVGEAPATAAPTDAVPDAAPQLIVLSARTEPALAALASRLADGLESRGATDLADVAFTMAVGRAHQATRAALAVASTADLGVQLRHLAQGAATTAAVSRLTTLDPQPVAFVFPAGVPGLPRRGAGPAALEAALDRAIEMMRPHAGDQWADALRDRTMTPGGREDRDITTFVLQVALAETLQGWGIQPSAVAGAGVGLAAAAAVAGALAHSEAAALVAAHVRRARTGDAAFALAVAGVNLGTPHTPLLGPSAAPVSTADFRAACERWVEPSGTVPTEALSREIGSLVVFGETPREAGGDGGVVGLWPDGQSSGPPETLHALGRCHQRGIPVDWQAVYAGQSRRRLALPTYPFERQRHWIATAPGSMDTAAAQAIDPERVAAVEAARREEAARRRQALADALPADRDDLLLSFVREHVRAVLHMADGDGPDRRHRLIDLGLDSLMVVELRNRLEAGLGLAGVLPATLVFDYPSIEAIAGFLDRALRDAAPAAPGREDAAASDARPGPMAEDFDDLTDEQAEALLIQRLGNL